MGYKEKLQNIRQNVQKSIEDVDKSIGKIDAFGTGMREAEQRLPTRSVLLQINRKRNMGKRRFSKTELIKKPFQAKEKATVRYLEIVRMPP